MKIREIAEILEAPVLTPGKDIEREVYTACGSDMMSDVLAYVKDQAVLLTGLNNLQVVRTADMMEMECIVFVRGKKPEAAIVEMAQEKGIAVIASDKTMFSACGLLYEGGLRESK